MMAVTTIAEPILRTRGLTRRFGGVTALQGLDLAAPAEGDR